MRNFKEPSLAERQGAATKAKKAALVRFHENMPANNPAVAERLAERQAAHTARTNNAAERKAAKLAREAELARDAAHTKQAEQDTLLKAEQLASEQAARDRASQEADDKAARDARYAARKARQK
jgi:hypothetical protein